MGFSGHVSPQMTMWLPRNLAIVDLAGHNCRHDAGLKSRQGAQLWWLGIGLREQRAVDDLSAPGGDARQGASSAFRRRPFFAFEQYGEIDAAVSLVAARISDTEPTSSSAGNWLCWLQRFSQGGFERTRRRVIAVNGQAREQFSEKC